MFLKKTFLALALALSVLMSPVSVSAQTLLPSETTGGCETLYTTEGSAIEMKGGACLYEKIQTGKMHFADIPYFIGYIIKFLLSIAGGLTVIFIMIGGFQYIFGGLMKIVKAKAKTPSNWH